MKLRFEFREILNAVEIEKNYDNKKIWNFPYGYANPVLSYSPNLNGYRNFQIPQSGKINIYF